MDDNLKTSLYQKLVDDGSLDQDWSVYVIGACEGPHELESTIIGKSIKPPVVDARRAEPEPLGAYLGPLTIQGFRGIGPEVTLPLEPGPGLTLVVGRNGSGKSSLAEGLEVLLTRTNKRWENRTQVWKDGWRNLHHPHPALIEADVLIEGAPGTTKIVQEWEAADAGLEGGRTYVQQPGKARGELESLGWTQALGTFRPFLSYNELGSMLEEGQAKLHDALSAILGLDDLVEAQQTLREARLQRERALKAVKADLDRLRPRFETLDDERAAACKAALATRDWDLAAVEWAVLGSTGDDRDGAIDVLRRATALEAPSADRVQTLATDLRTAAATLQEAAGTDAHKALEIAGLLERALAFHAGHGDGDCPVCGNAGALDSAWRADATEQIERLRTEASTAQEAQGALDRAMAAARDALAEPPAVLQRLAEIGIDSSAATTAWTTWADGHSLEDPAALADHLERTAPPLAKAVTKLAEAATAELQRREDRWRPVALELAAWLDAAKDATDGAAAVPGLKQAEAWLKDATAQMRNERFQPIAAQAMANWELLRTHSNVQLGKIELIGASTARRVSLDVTIDDVGGAALGVMSQGELHALALSLFLPRATHPESPFRFIVIDDPVQSMDPARVDGLARVLEHTAKTRQVVVFTHDDRLAEAIRRLNIQARILKVTRREHSVVELTPSLDPVSGNVEAARTLAATRELPQKVAARLVPGFCRAAIEAALMQSVRRRRLRKGQGHAEVEEELADAGKLMNLAALALLNDKDRGGEVLTTINQRFGRRAGDAFMRCKEGAHGGFEGRLGDLIQDSEKLARSLEALE